MKMLALCTWLPFLSGMIAASAIATLPTAWGMFICIAAAAVVVVAQQILRDVMRQQ